MGQGPSPPGAGCMAWERHPPGGLLLGAGVPRAQLWLRLRPVIVLVLPGGQRRREQRCPPPFVLQANEPLSLRSHVLLGPDPPMGAEIRESLCLAPRLLSLRGESLRLGSGRAQATFNWWFF
ncbi:activator of 90 kDa heat shock protein ATPase-like protein 1 [Platysternon megacephalum]|uniref:Activator of 90 kDa heat shock protein ATPase-like protein 1 n=1 Tax=Platysternon megacephalum TaxID=55544 RepID=A0A4D9EUK8_9SAUR|nr:activator of 90 kDa heat shock protein ATPase-like protein 1 [Platysternon megacephalum]